MTITNRTTPPLQTSLWLNAPQPVTLDDLRASEAFSEDVLRAYVLSQEGNHDAADELMANVSRRDFFEGLSSVGAAMEACTKAS